MNINEIVDGPFVIHEEVRDVETADLHRACDLLNELEEEIESFCDNDDPRLDAIRAAHSCVVAILGDRNHNNRQTA